MKFIILFFYGEIIEDYTNHQPYPRCLIYGENFAKEPIHSVWDYDQETDTAILITVYRPDPKRLYKPEVIRYFAEIRTKLKNQETKDFELIGQSFSVR